MYEHRCLENIKNIYQSSGKCDDQQNYKAILEAYMVSTPEVFSENSPLSSGPFMSTKQPKARKPLCKFATTLNVKPKTYIHRICADKSKCKEIISCSQVWSKIPNIQGHTKINEHVNIAFYYWILCHPQIVQSPIANNCLKITINRKTAPQLVSRFLLQV